MAVANPATVAGMKGFTPNLTRQRLRAAQREAAKQVYKPDTSSELAAAVAQLATSATVSVRTQDELATVRVHKKGAVEGSAEDEPQISSKVAKPTQPKKASADQQPRKPKQQEEEKATQEKKALSKKERRDLRRQEQAHKRALAEDKKREKRKVVEEQKQQRLAEKQVTVKPTGSVKPKATVAKPKATQSGIQETKARYVRLSELRAKFNRYPEEVVDASSLSAKAAMCSFDFSVFLQHLLDGEPKQAQAYLSSVASHSKPLMQAIISPYLDEICDALHSGRTPDETLHSHEELEPHVKLKFEDPLSRKSDTQLLWDEGGMDLYPFSETVYVTVTDGEGNVLQAERKMSQQTEQYRTKMYISWLEQRYTIPKGVVELNAFDRKGKILNDFSLQFVTDTVPVMVGNLQVGMEFRMSEQYVPLSWEVKRFKHELSRKDSQVCRKHRGSNPIGGIVGLDLLEGLVDAGPAVAANDDVPWEEGSEEFVPLPNPKLGDAKCNPRIIPYGLWPPKNPEYRDNLRLRSPVRAVKWVDRGAETLSYLFLKSMTEPDKPVGLWSNPEYRWDPGPPEVTDNVVQGPASWFENTPRVLGHEFVGPPAPSKQPVVGVVTRKQSALSQLVEAEKRALHRGALRRKARVNLTVYCPELNTGWRSLRRMQDPKMKRLHPVTIGYWVRIYAQQREAMREERRLNSWFKRRNRISMTTDEALLYKEWHRTADTHVLREGELQDHLGNMESVAPSTVYDYECHLCDSRIREREQDAEIRKQSMVRNNLGMMVLDMKLYSFKKRQLSKHKAEQEAAGKHTAKTREPGIRAASPPKSNHASSGSGGQVHRDTRGYDLSNFNAEEKAAFTEHIEGRDIDLPWWRKVNQLKPSQLIDKAAEFWVTRGTFLVPPAYG